MNKIMKRILMGWMLVMTAGCSNSVFVLMPSPDGSVGAIDVTTEGGSRTVSEAGHAVEVRSGENAPSAPVPMKPEKIESIFGEAMAGSPKLPEKYLIYFDNGATGLSKESKDIIPKIIKEAASRDVYNINVIGHSDKVGSQEFNLKLSLQRAQFVKDLLVSKGIEKDVIEIGSHGEENPLIPTPDNVSEPRNRRVEVVIQ